MEHIRAVEEGSGNNDWVSGNIIEYLVCYLLDIYFIKVNQKLDGLLKCDRSQVGTHVELEEFLVSVKE